MDARKPLTVTRYPATKDDVAKRTSQGRTKKEIIRSLKRYITRQIYRTLNHRLVLASST